MNGRTKVRAMKMKALSLLADSNILSARKVLLDLEGDQNSTFLLLRYLLRHCDSTRAEYVSKLTEEFVKTLPPIFALFTLTEQRQMLDRVGNQGLDKTLQEINEFLNSFDHSVFEPPEFKPPLEPQTED